MEVVHTTADNNRLLVLHGHIFDDVVRTPPWIEALGSNLYDGSRYMNTGGWVAHCTALIENEAGKMQLIDWVEFHKRQLELDISPLKTPQTA